MAKATDPRSIVQSVLKEQEPDNLPNQKKPVWSKLNMPAVARRFAVAYMAFVL
jgi:hypothetical protein